MDATSSQRESCVLQPSLGAPAVARDFVAATLQAWHVEDDFPDVGLLTSELVTNAVRHARGDVALALDHVDGRCVRIEVSDRSEQLPTMRDLESARDGGWGLHIVTRLATRWGLERQAGEKTIWCEVGPSA